MSTHSAIGVMHGDKIKVVYCNFDGYLSHNGRILQENYNSPKANQLVALGDLSALKREVVAPEDSNHSYDTPVDGVSIFYGRDRKETGVDFQVCFSDEDLFETYEVSYYYIMKDGVWHFSQGEGTEWKLLADALREDSEAGFKAPSITRLIMPTE